MAIDIGKVIDLGGQDILCRTLFTNVTAPGQQSLSGSVSSTAGSGGQLVDAEQFIILQSDGTGSAWGNSTISVFQSVATGSGISLGSGQYAFEGQYYLQNANSGTATAWQTLFGGTATLGTITYLVTGNNSTAVTPVQAGGLSGVVTGATATTVTPSFASAGASTSVAITLNGVLNVSTGAAGTVIPQIKPTGTLAAAAGNQTIKAGTFFRIWSVGAASTQTVGAVP